VTIRRWIGHWPIVMNGRNMEWRPWPLSCPFPLLPRVSVYGGRACQFVMNNNNNNNNNKRKVTLTDWGILRKDVQKLYRLDRLHFAMTVFTFQFMFAGYLAYFGVVMLCVWMCVFIVPAKRVASSTGASSWSPTHSQPINHYECTQWRSGHWPDLRHADSCPGRRSSQSFHRHWSSHWNSRTLWFRGRSPCIPQWMQCRIPRWGCWRQWTRYWNCDRHGAWS